MMVDAINPALEDREITFNRVGMGIAPGVLTGGVLDRAMTGERLSYFPVDPAFVCAEM
jgi:hypothetical protein